MLCLRTAEVEKTVTTSPTIRDVAKHAGVSVATVSRSLNNQVGISEDTRQRVFSAANELGYNLSNLRQQQGRSRLKRVSFLYRRLKETVGGNPFYSHVLHGVEDACRTEKLGLSYSSIGGEDQVPELVARQEADGLVCVGYFEPEQLRAVLTLNLPTVLVDHWYPGFTCVNSDNFGGAYLLTEHLIHQGFRRIAFVSGPQTHYSIAQRVQGYRHALLAHGLTLDPRLEAARFPLEEEEGTESAMRQLLQLEDRPDAVFAFNDATALQALRICQMQGLRVPDDIAVVGFDDLSSAALAFPTLTTVRVDKEALGSRGVEALLHSSSSGALITLPVSLVVRESSVRPGKSRNRT